MPHAAIPDLGPNVLLFDPSQPASEMQSRLDAIFAQQEANQFGLERFAVLFQPGQYELDVSVGFYTQVLGLGDMPDSVTLRGNLRSDANWLGSKNATCNFWRSCENLAVVPAGTAPSDTAPSDTAPVCWAVSQATAMRRVHIHGDLNLWDGGWSSGGFLADSQIDGVVNSGSQQQWLSRNAEWGRWTGHNWNMVFVGVASAPPGDWPDPAYTVVARTPRIREKPFLCVGAEGQWAVQVPAARPPGTAGTSWADGPPAAAIVPLDRFHVARADRDNAATLNAALDAGRHLLLTPGIYHLDSSLRVTYPNTIVLGLGFATLLPEQGTPALTVADVDGVSLAGLLIEAGSVKSEVLVQIGEPGSRLDHSQNPTYLYDLHCRVGGAAAGSASVCLQINSSHVVVDNTWLWRADHGAGAEWDENPCASGLVVNGDNVTMYGLFAEHFQEYQTLWNGEKGEVYFYQSELPYDAPSLDRWQHDGVAGYASYKVADGVQQHQAWGLGVYGVFTRSPVPCFNAVEAPTAPGIALHHLISVYIVGEPGTEITHIVSGTGPTTSRDRQKATLDLFPPR